MPDAEPELELEPEAELEPEPEPEDEDDELPLPVMHLDELLPELPACFNALLTASDGEKARA